jgi:sugar-specific transcriptional regulator TrmB
MLEKNLQQLGLPENAVKILFRLLEYGSSSARQLAENLGIPRPSVYDYLKILSEQGLVTERTEDNKKIFQIDNLRHLPELVQTKIDQLQQVKKELKSTLPNLLKQTASFEPKIKFFSGVEGIKQILKDLLWYEKIETLTMWPINEMIDLLGRDYLENLNRRRIRQQIAIKGIWPADKKVDLKYHPYLGVGSKHLRQLRIAPEKMTWEMSYWLYADKVAFISGKEECFGFLIHSKSFANLIKAQFEVIWRLSKPVKPEPQYTDDFLQTI